MNLHLHISRKGWIVCPKDPPMAAQKFKVLISQNLQQPTYRYSVRLLPSSHNLRQPWQTETKPNPNSKILFGHHLVSVFSYLAPKPLDTKMPTMNPLDKKALAAQTSHDLFPCHSHFGE